jgi:hypothetical protein
MSVVKTLWWLLHTTNSPQTINAVEALRSFAQHQHGRRVLNDRKSFEQE